MQRGAHVNTNLNCPHVDSYIVVSPRATGGPNSGSLLTGAYHPPVNPISCPTGCSPTNQQYQPNQPVVTPPIMPTPTVGSSQQLIRPPPGTRFAVQGYTTLNLPGLKDREAWCYIL